MWELHISGQDKVLPMIWELAEKVESEHGIRLRRMSRRTLRKDLDVFGEIYNEAWSRNWGFVPYSKTDLDAYAQEMHIVFDPDWFMVAETAAGEPVGVAITVPDINQVQRLMNGRLCRSAGGTTCVAGASSTAAGWASWAKRDYQHTGVAAALYAEHFHTSERTRQVGRDGLDPRDQHGP